MKPLFRQARQALRCLLQAFIKQLICHTPTRRLLNALYLAAPFNLHVRAYDYCAKLFRSGEVPALVDRWRVRVADADLYLPLRADQTKLDWDLALTLLGHDPQVKQTYFQLLRSNLRPDLFVDIGANYGTHSLFFLSQRIDTLTFEPNAACHPYFSEACRINRLTSRLEGVAVGSSPTELDLWFPVDETWLGSVNLDIKTRLEAEYQLVSQRVRVVTLDDYLDQLRGRQVLLKIDTEGNELEVLLGAQRTLAQCRPHVIFETLRGALREHVFDFFVEHQYRIQPLPYDPAAVVPDLQRAEFVASRVDNFVAVPVGR